MKNIWRAVSAPPYPYLPWLVWLYVIACSVILGTGSVYNGHLIGYDDQVRMVQVLDWINGHGWYDRTIMRANPPEGFTTIWSRIVDIPIALVIVIAQQFMPQKAAAMIAATIIPLTELAILFVAAPYFVRPLVGKAKARLIVLFLPFTSILYLKFFSASGFLIGQVSHHPWYIILNLTMFGAAARMVMGSTRLSPVLMMGMSIALFTAVGIEGYPLIAGCVAILAALAWGYGRPVLAARAGDAALCGAIGALLLLPMHRPAEQFFVVSFAEPSILGVLLIFCAALFLKIEQQILQRMPGKAASVVSLGAIAAVIAVLLVHQFPDMLNGGAAGLSPEERKMALSDHYEAKSIWAMARSLLEFINWSMPIFIGLGFGIYAVTNSKNRRQAVSLCYLGCAALGSLMSMTYSRYYHHAMTSACAWLLWAWEQIKKRLKKNQGYALKNLGAFILLGPLFMLLLPALEMDAPVLSNIVLFPAAVQISPDSCDSLPMANYINAHYSTDTLLIVPSWNSAQYLFQTDVRIDFLSNYPSQNKFIDNFAFFGTRDTEQARQIARRHKIQLVAICRAPLLFNPDYPASMQSFLSLLQVGRVPNWLRLVQTQNIPNYLLYEVDQKEVNGEKP